MPVTDFRGKKRCPRTCSVRGLVVYHNVLCAVTHKSFSFAVCTAVPKYIVV